MLLKSLSSVLALASGALATYLPELAASTSAINGTSFPASVDLLSIDLKAISELLQNQTITSVQLVTEYLARIELNNHDGLLLRAVIETAPRQEVLALAAVADEQRRNGTAVGSLHGIPILVKDNIATETSLGMNTTAGSYALLGMPVPRDAHVVAKLRKAGAIILGKANLSEWANFRGNITNGWSGRGGQTQSAYVAGGFAAGGDPCGSSAGSGVAISAGWAASSLGSETDGSIICPSNRAALFGLKPTVGLVSRAGVVPLSSTQDTTGPMAKSAYDAALLLEVIAGFDERDNATYAAIDHVQTNYTQFASGECVDFAKYRLGVPRTLFFDDEYTGNPPEINNAMNAAIQKIMALGANVTDPADMPSALEIPQSNNESIVLYTDFKVDLGTYLMELGGDITTGVRSLEDAINFNDANAELEFPPGECCQQTFIKSVQTTGKSSPEYIAARAANVDLGLTRGIDYVLDHYNLDALILPSEGWSTVAPAISGGPIGTVPLGYLNATGQPFGLAFIVRRWDEPTLISLMAAFEREFPARRVPSQLV